MKQTVVMFCYRGEEEILPITVSRVRAMLPLASVHLFDDAKDPLTEPVRDGLLEMSGVFYEQTTFDRQRNLNGAECIRGELHCMQQAADRDDNTDGFVVKMDPDTLILRADAILQLLSAGCRFLAGTSQKGIFSGMFYGMRRDILDVVVRNADVVEFPDRAAEDESIGALAYMAAAKGRYQWFNAFLPEMRKYFAAFDVTKVGKPDYQTDIEFVARHGHIITTGNTGINKLPPFYRVQVARDLLAAVARQAREPLAKEAKAAPEHVPYDGDGAVSRVPMESVRVVDTVFGQEIGNK